VTFLARKYAAITADAGPRMSYEPSSRARTTAPAMHGHSGILR
jgi:hypothetical protein